MVCMQCKPWPQGFVQGLQNPGKKSNLQTSEIARSPNSRLVLEPWHSNQGDCSRQTWHHVTCNDVTQ